MAGVNLWELVAKVQSDFRDSDRAIDQNEKKVVSLTSKYKTLDQQAEKTSQSHGKLGQTFSGLQQTITSTGGPLNNLTSQFSGLISTGGELSLTAGGIGVALGIVVTATVGAIAGIYSLTTASAELTGKFVDLSQQTGFQVETLSALGNAAETSGGNIDSVSNALFIFETHMGEAREKGSEMSKMFQTLGIDTHNNEVALRQALDAISGMTDAEVKATIGKKLFGKSVKDLLGSLAEAGNLDKFLNQQLQEGTLITTKSAKMGDELSDTVTILGRRFQAAGRVVAEEFTPMVVDGLQTLSKWLVDNQKEIGDTAKEIVKLIGDITSLANLIYSISPLRLEIEIVRRITSVLDFGSSKDEKGVVSSGPGGQSMFDKFWDWMDRGSIKDPSGAFGPATGDPNATQAQRDAAVRQYNDNLKAQKAAEEAARKKTDAVNKMLAGGGRGGGGGGKRVDVLKEQKQLLDAMLRNTLESLDGEEKGIKRSYEERRLAQARYFQATTALEDKRHEAVIESVNAEIELAKKQRDPKKRELELIQLGTEKQREMNRHADEQYRISQDIKSVTRDRIVLTETLIQRMEREREVLKQINQERSRFKSEVFRDDLGGGSGVLTPEVRDRTGRPRVATTDEIVKRERLEIFHQRMRDLASDITFIIDDAMREGFEHGMKSGLKAFGLGILEMARHAALKQLEKALDAVFENVFSKIGAAGAGGKQGGGGIWSTILNFGLSALGALFGGGGSGSAGGLGAAAAGGFADGGWVRPNAWALVGERGPEYIKTGYQGATVVSNEDSMGMTNHYHNWNVNTPDAHSFQRRDTQRQIQRKMAKFQRAA